MRQHKILLDECEMPTRWYNLLPDLPSPPPPVLHPGTRQPVGPDDLAPLFPMALIEQEVTTEQYVDIPERGARRLPALAAVAARTGRTGWRRRSVRRRGSTTSTRASRRPARTSRTPRCRRRSTTPRPGIRRLTTETGAGQWGTALAFACAQFGLECEVWQVRASYDQKPYRQDDDRDVRRHGAPLPVGRSPPPAGPSWPSTPTPPARSGIAISEAVEVAAQHPDTNYALGSVLNHVLLHQTVIGEEALLQLAQAGETPDVIVGCTGGGSNFGGLAFPFLREKLAGRMSPTIRAVEPAACPSLTRGVYAYDFGDTAGMTPLMKMHTLGHDFVPDPIHAGGLRYHGMCPLISHVYETGLIEAIAKPQPECFEAGVLFARTEGIVPAPEPTHALAAAIEEARAVHGDRRGEGDPDRAVRPRPPRPGRVRRLPGGLGDRSRVGRLRHPGGAASLTGAAAAALLTRRVCDREAARRRGTGTGTGRQDPRDADQPGRRRPAARACCSTPTSSS